MAKRAGRNKNSPVVVNPDTGENTILTKELANNIIKYFRLGLTDTAVANMAGVKPDTLSTWLKRGYAYNNGIHGELFRECAKATAELELEFIIGIREQAMGAPAEYEKDDKGKVIYDRKGRPLIKKKEIAANPEWMAWFLEKRFKRKYGRQQEIGFAEGASVDEGKLTAPLPENAGGSKGAELNPEGLSNDETEKILKAALVSVQSRNVGQS